MASFETIDDYIASFPPDVQARLEQVRQAIRRMAAGTEETISYGIPTFTMKGRYVVYFAGWKNHISLYPVPAGDPAFEREIAPYQAGKGTLRFALDKPIPIDLVERIVALLMQQHAARAR